MKRQGFNEVFSTKLFSLNVSPKVCVYVTRPGKTGLIYAKYTSLYYGTYLFFCMCYLIKNTPGVKKVAAKN